MSLQAQQNLMPQPPGISGSVLFTQCFECDSIPTDFLHFMSLQNLRFSIRRPHPGHFLVVFCSNSKVAGSFSFSWYCLHVKPSCHKILHLKQLLALHFWHSHRGTLSAVRLAHLLPS